MPIELTIEQGTREWIEARLGIPTASGASRVVTNGGKLSSARSTYLGELLAEWYMGEPFADFESEWMERGTRLEAEAFDFYAFTRDAEPRKVGLVYRDEDRMVAASPDALVNGDGGLELKCPRTDTHLVYLAMGGLPQKYTAQVQTCLWVTGRQWWDFMSYHPGLPELLVRVEPDETYHAALDKHMLAFIDEVLTARAALEAAGVKRWKD